MGEMDKIRELMRYGKTAGSTARADVAKDVLLLDGAQVITDQRDLLGRSSTWLYDVTQFLSWFPKTTLPKLGRGTTISLVQSGTYEGPLTADEVTALSECPFAEVDGDGGLYKVIAYTRESELAGLVRDVWPLLSQHVPGAGGYVLRHNDRGHWTMEVRVTKNITG